MVQEFKDSLQSELEQLHTLVGMEHFFDFFPAYVLRKPVRTTCQKNELLIPLCSDDEENIALLTVNRRKSDRTCFEMEVRPIVNLTVFLHLLSSTISTSPMTVLFAMVSTIQLRNLPPKPMKSMIPNISQSVLIPTVRLRLSWSFIHRCFPDVCPFAYSSRYLTRNS